MAISLLKLHLFIIYMYVTRIYKSIRTKKSEYFPSKVPTKLGYKRFEITECFILVHDPEVTESCNNGQLLPFRMHSYDYLEIIKDGRMVGKYCGQRTGTEHSFNWRPDIDNIPLRRKCAKKGIPDYISLLVHTVSTSPNIYFFVIYDKGGD